MADVFNCPVGEEKLEFHQAVFKLKDHLSDVPPLELSFDVQVTQNTKGQPDVYFYELPVFEYSASRTKQIDFLVKCDYDFFGTISNKADHLSEE